MSEEDRKKIDGIDMKKLKSHGFAVVEPMRGRLACADDAFGHIADTQVIVSKTLTLL